MHLNGLSQLSLDQALNLTDITGALPTTGESAGHAISTGTLEEPLQKSQQVRLLDMFILGPVMLWAGLGRQLPEGAKAVLFLTGTGTILYNGYNYLQNAKLLEGQK